MPQRMLQTVRLEGKHEHRPSNRLAIQDNRERPLRIFTTEAAMTPTEARTNILRLLSLGLYGARDLNADELAAAERLLLEHEENVRQALLSRVRAGFKLQERLEKAAALYGFTVQPMQIGDSPEPIQPPNMATE